MKITEIEAPGFYWNRADEHRAWGMVYLKRQMPNPEHPRHNQYEICNNGVAGSNNSLCSIHGDFIGPITPPER